MKKRQYLPAFREHGRGVTLKEVTFSDSVPACAGGCSEYLQRLIYVLKASEKQSAARGNRSE